MSVQTQLKRITVPEIRSHKGAKPVVCLTCYHAHTAKLLDAYVDLMLVGDSLGMVMHGLETTVGVTLDMMITHAKAVMRGSKRALVVVDMPFGSYEESPNIAFRNAARIIQETGATAVKLEGGTRMAETIQYLTQRGIPVMGHLGMTPQSVNAFGGFKVQGRGGAAEAIIGDAKALQEAGCFAIVLELIPAELASRIRSEVSIPVIGIGAGADCDAQVLVWTDLMGLTEKAPRFARAYRDLRGEMSGAVKEWMDDVATGRFPNEAETFH